MRNLIWIFLFVFSSSLSAQMEVDGEILYGNEWIDYNKTYAKVIVNEDGIYRVSKSELLSSGIPIDQISLTNLELYYLGKSIGFYVESNEDFIEFYGVRNRSYLEQFIYLDKDHILNPEYSVVSDESAYFITWADNINPLLISEIEIDLTNNILEPESFYMHQEMTIANSVHYKPTLNTEQVRYSSFVASEGYGTGLKNKNIIDVPISNTVNNGNDATVSVRFGSNRTPHRTEITINGNIIDTVNNERTEVVLLDYQISTDLLGQNNMRLELKGLFDSGSDYSTIAYAKVKYPRSFEIIGDTSMMFHIEPSSNERYFEIAGYTIVDKPLIYDLNDRQRIVPEITSDGKVGFLLPPNSITKEIYITSSLYGIKSPITVENRKFVDYNNSDYNYILISNADLRKQDATDWVEEYAKYRESQEGGSFNPVIANVDQLYDQFAYGVNRHFIAFRNFGYWTQKNYTKPEFMFIIGKGREYRENRLESQIQENVDAYVPTWGNPGSDNMILSTNELPLPIYPIGRLAAKNAQEVKEYLEKVIEHDENLNNPQTIEDRLWQKRVLHLSGGDASLQETLANNLAIMEDTLENNAFGAEVTTYYKKSIEAIEVATSDRIFKLINDGISIITFFGHSSVGKFDFSIDNIDEYSNKGKYPLVFSLGCYSGNIHTDVEGISEQFVVRKDKGAICFIAASGTAYVGQQFQAGLNYYERLGKEDYGKPIGTILNNVIEEFSSNTNFTYVTFLQQLTLHGDPAIRIASYNTPDLIPDEKSIRTNPTFVDTYEDDFEICFDVANIGKSIRAEYDILVEHYGPDGELETDTTIRGQVPYFNENYCIKMPLSSNKLVGKNVIKVFVDSSEEIEELPSPEAEFNNKLVSSTGIEGFEFYILNNSAIPIYPKKFSIVNEANISLVSSTYNALGEDQNFTIQIDTTESFNSPQFRETEISNIKGLIEWQLDFSLLPKTVYYWRISPDSTTTGVGYVWSESSFVYDLNERDGWNQSHYFQYLTNDFVNMSLEGNRKFFFAKNLKEVLIANKVHEGGLPAQFIIDNGFWGEAYHRNSAPAIAVTVIDTLGKFFKNDVGGEYGSLNPYSVPIITYYFKTDNQQSRIDLIDFLENDLPDEYYACVYNIYKTVNTDFKVEEWAADSLVNNGKNIFNVLEAEGSLKIREFQKLGMALPYGFIYQKGVSPLSEGIAEDINSTIEVKEQLPGFWFEGSFTSDFIGPALSWDEVVWDIDETSEMPMDTSFIRIYGYDLNRLNEKLIYDKILDKSLDLKLVDASKYPYIKVEFYANDFKDVSPVQVDLLRVYYEGYGDVAINTTQNYSFYGDSLQQGDDLKMVYDISNFSNKPISSIKAEYKFIDKNNEVITTVKDLPDLAARESKTVSFTFDTRPLLGEYQFQLELNPGKSPMEEYYFNNFGLGEFKVTPDEINPLLNVMFDGIVIMDQDIVSSKPLITIELLDENPFILLENPENFTILLESPNKDITQINMDDPAIQFYPAVEEEDNKSRIEFNPELNIDGEYKLTIEARDESSNISGDKTYEVRFRVFNEELVSNVFNYPNPFSTSTQFIFTLTGDEEPGNVLIRIMTLTGKVVREITTAELGPLRIGINRTDYKWDGRDEYGDKLGNGTYLYQVITKKLDGSDYKHFSDPTQNNTDYLFKKGFGKLVIIR
jgi:hypothetical protein